VPSGAGEAALTVATPSRRMRARATFAVVLLLLGLLVTVVPGLAAGDEFRRGLPGVVVVTPVVPAQSSAPAPPSGELCFRVLTADRTVRVRNGGPAITLNQTLAFTITSGPPTGSSLTDLVLHEAGWTTAALGLVIAPLLFVWWQRRGVSFARMLGIACSLAAGAAVGALVFESRARFSDAEGGNWWTLPLGAALMGAAFVVAPAPGRRSDE
jgi:hypothetical protein